MSSTVSALMAIGAITWNSANAQEISMEVRNRLTSLESSFKETAAQLEESHVKLNSSYLSRLETVRTKAKQNGDLEKVLAVQEEISAPGTKRIQFEWTEFTKLQTIYLEQVEHLQSNLTNQQAQLISQYQQRLQLLQEELTKADRLEEAIVVKEASANIGSWLPKPVLSASKLSKNEKRPAGSLKGWGKIGGNQVDLSHIPKGLQFHTIRSNHQSEWVAQAEDGRVYSSKREHHALEGLEIFAGHSQPMAVQGNTIIGSDGQLLYSVPFSSVARVRAGGMQVAMSPDGKLAEWGRYKTFPFPEETEEGVIDVDSATSARMAVTKSGKVVVWGPYQKDLERLRETTDRIKGATRIDAGAHHFLILDEDGDVTVAASRDGEETKRCPRGGRVLKVRASHGVSAVLFENGKWYAWGDDSSNVVTTINQLPTGVIDLAFSSKSELDAFVVWIDLEE